MRFLFLISLLGALASAQASEIAPDKKLHFLGSAAISGAARIALDGNPDAFGYSVLAGFGVGLAKEISDKKTTGFSRGDLIADFAGAVAGAYFAEKAIRPFLGREPDGGLRVGFNYTASF